MPEVDHVISGRLGAARMLLEQAQEEEASLKEHWGAKRAEVQKLEEEVRRLESYAAGNRGKLTMEAVRDVVMRFRGGFTKGELAVELGFEPKDVDKHLRAMLADGTIREAMKLGRNMIYEWVKPEGAGESFEAQQRLTAPEPEIAETAVPIAGTGRPQRLPGPLADTVRAAERAGWTLTRGDGGHFKLSKGSRMISVPSTPQSPEIAAKRLWDQVQGKRHTERSRLAAS